MANQELQFAQRFAEQDARLDKVINMVDALTNRVLMQQELTDRQPDPRGLRRLRDRVEAIEVSVREKVEEIEANISYLASEYERQGLSPAEIQAAVAAPHNFREVMSVAVDSLAARLDRHLNEVSRKLEDLQDGREQQRLEFRQIHQQLSEVAHKLDQLWSQCQYYFPRVKEHDVHFGFFRTSFESHKQLWLDQTESGCLPEHLASMKWSESLPRSPRVTSPQHTQTLASFPSPPVTTQIAPTNSSGADIFSISNVVAAPIASAALPSQGAGSLTVSSEGLMSSVVASSALGKGALIHIAGASKPGPSSTELSAAEEDAELNARQSMLQQVMERLHSNNEDGGDGVEGSTS